MPDKGKLLCSAYRICDEAGDAGLISFIQKQFPVTITIGRIDVRKKLSNNTKIIRFSKKETQSFEMIFIRPEVTQFFMINSKIPGLIEEIIIAVKKKFKSYMVEYDQSAPAEGQETNNIPTLPKINKGVLREIYTIISGSELNQTKTESLMLLLSKLYLKEFNPEELQKDVADILLKICQSDRQDTKTGEEFDQGYETNKSQTSDSDKNIIANLIRLMEFTGHDREENPAIKYIKEFLSKIIQTVIQLEPHADILEACHQTIKEVLKSKAIFLAILDEFIEEKTTLSTDRKIETAGIEKTLSETTDAFFRTDNGLTEIREEIKEIERRNNERFAAIGNLTTDIKNLPRIGEISQQINAENKRIETLNLEAQTLNEECLEHRRKESILRDKLTGINKGIERLNSEIDMLKSSKATIKAIIEGRLEIADSSSAIESVKSSVLSDQDSSLKAPENARDTSCQKSMTLILDLNLLTPYQFFEAKDEGIVRNLAKREIKLSDVIMRLIIGLDKLEAYLSVHQIKIEYAKRIFELAQRHSLFDNDGNFDIENGSIYVLAKKSRKAYFSTKVKQISSIKKHRPNERKTSSADRISAQEFRKNLEPLKIIDVRNVIQLSNLRLEEPIVDIISERSFIDLLIIKSDGHLTHKLKPKIGLEITNSLSEFLGSLKIVNCRRKVNITKMNKFIEDYQRDI